MFSFSKTTLLAALLASTSLVGAIPTAQLEETKLEPRASSYWVETIQRQGTVAFGDSAFKVFRNVKDYGAKG